MRDPRQEMIELERRYWRAIQDQDVEAAVELTDFPCVIAGATGIGRVEEGPFRSMMRSASYSLDAFEVKDDAQVRLLTEEVAVVAYRVHEELTLDGASLTIDASDASTWVRRDGDWRCALHVEALAGDPYGRDRVATTGASARGGEPAGAARGTEDEEAIVRLVTAWIRAAWQGDVPSLHALASEDAVFMVPGRPPLARGELAEHLRATKDGIVNVEAEVEDLYVLGGWAWYRTRVVVTVADRDGDTSRRSGGALTIVRRREDGSWVIVRDAST